MGKKKLDLNEQLEKISTTSKEDKEYNVLVVAFVRNVMGFYVKDKMALNIFRIVKLNNPEADQNTIIQKLKEYEYILKH